MPRFGASGLARLSAELGRPCGGLAARADAELAENGGDVVIDSSLRQYEARCDVAVPQAVGQQAEDFELARRQAVGVRPCRGARPTRKSPSALLAQPACDDGFGRACIEALKQLEGAT